MKWHMVLLLESCLQLLMLCIDGEMVAGVTRCCQSLLPSGVVEIFLEVGGSSNADIADAADVARAVQPAEARRPCFSRGLLRECHSRGDMESTR